MSNLQTVLIVDLGTSGPKVSIYDSKLKLIGYEFEDIPLLREGAHSVEQKPSDWTNAIQNCYQRLLKKNIFDPKSVVALNVTAQWSGTVPVDHQGNPLANAITCMDSRGAPYADRLTRGLLNVDGYGLFKVLKWIKITGGIPTKSGKDSISHILYLQNEKPELYRKTYKFLEPKDYLNLYFSGVFAASYDSITIHWLTDNRKINEITYSNELIRLIGIDRDKLPDLVPTNSRLGLIKKELAQEWGLSESVQVISGTPDIHSAAVGSGAAKDYEAHLYYGTSSWISGHVPFKKTDLLHNIASIPSGLPGSYMLVNEQQTAGACLNFLKNQLFYPNDVLNAESAPQDFYQRLDQLAESVAPGSDGLIFLPWLNGERSPVDDLNLRSSFFNFSMSHERKHFVRAVFEGVAMNSRWLLIYAEKLAGRQFEAISFIGGGAMSRVWCQILADVFNRPIKQMKDPITANSRGAAALALLSLGLLKREDIGSSVEVVETFHPQEKNRNVYDTHFKNYLELYKKNKNIFGKLNKGKA